MGEPNAQIGGGGSGTNKEVASHLGGKQREGGAKEVFASGGLVACRNILS